MFNPWHERSSHQCEGVAPDHFNRNRTDSQVVCADLCKKHLVPFCATHRLRQPLRRKGLRRLANSGCATAAQTVLPRKHEKTAGSECFQRFLCAPQVGLEPTTLRLTAECSAIELLRNKRIRRRPMLPGRVQPSTFGTEGLNFCVRDGNRWDPFVIATGNGE